MRAAGTCADLLTPNIPEAEKIAGMSIQTVEEMETTACKIHNLGCGAVVVKGGHAAGEALDVLFDGKVFHHFKTARINTKNTHGTGCTFSSAIAALLAQGMDLPDAVRDAKAYVTMAITHSLPIGKGNGPTHHFYELYRYGLREHIVKDITNFCFRPCKSHICELLQGRKRNF